MRQNLANLIAQIRSCDKCYLSTLNRGRGRANKSPVVGSGNPESDILLVGEALGTHEREQGLPFIGAAGQLLRRTFKSFLDLENHVFITNIVLCQPPGNSIESSYIESCYPNFQALLKMISPNIIITLGKTAYEGVMLTKVATITDKYIIRRKIGLNGKEVDVLPMAHPSAITRRYRAYQPGSIEVENAIKDPVWNQQIEWLKNTIVSIRKESK